MPAKQTKTILNHFLAFLWNLSALSQHLELNQHGFLGIARPYSNGISQLDNLLDPPDLGSCDVK